MKIRIDVLLIVVALVVGGFAVHTLASDKPQKNTDYQDNYMDDALSDCAARCVIEHNCCIKSCNWVEKKAKSKCLKHCESIVKKCHQQCDEKTE